jgi:RNA polymerase sigma-70 factor (ECF subfamily)
MDEETLLRASKDGDADAFNTLVVKYQSPIYNLALRMVGDSAAAEDIAQDSFISAYRNLHRFTAGNFRAWLFRIAANASRDYLRSPRVRRNTSLDLLAESPDFSLQSSSESPEGFALRRELSGAIHRGLAELPQDQRLALILVDLQGLSYEEAAQALRAPVGTIKSRLSRGRQAMRAFLLDQRELLPSQFR